MDGCKDEKPRWMKMLEGRKERMSLLSTEFFPEPFCESLNAHSEGGMGVPSRLELRHVKLPYNSFIGKGRILVRLLVYLPPPPSSTQK